MHGVRFTRIAAGLQRGALIACLLGMGLGGPALVGTDAVVGLLISFVRTGMFSLYGLIRIPELAIGVIIGVATFPGAFAARWMINRLSASVHVWIIEAMVVFAGASFLWRAWMT